MDATTQVYVGNEKFEIEIHDGNSVCGGLFVMRNNSSSFPRVEEIIDVTIASSLFDAIKDFMKTAVEREITEFYITDGSGTSYRITYSHRLA